MHYVPITLGTKELPETLRFLPETPEGQVIGKEIAEAGREGVGKVWRVVDMRVATFRILLEYARLYGEAELVVDPVKMIYRSLCSR